MMRTPRAYLDKGAFNAINLKTLSSHGFQIFFSEAILLDLKNDRTEIYKRELEEINNSDAIYLFTNDNKIYGERRDALMEFLSVDRSIPEIIAPAYRFMNGGGPEHSLSEAMSHQIKLLSNLIQRHSTENISAALEELVKSIPSEERELMDSIKSSKLRSELQSIGKPRTNNTTKRTDIDFAPSPETTSILRRLLPEFPTTFNEIVQSALLLGSIQLGQDKGITSPKDEKSLAAAENGYIDCLHIAYALHCDLFFTSDKSTLTRFKILSRHWNLKANAILVEKAPRRAPPSH